MGLKQIWMVINKKKIYRLMQENKLLLGSSIRVHGKSTFVKFRVIFQPVRWNTCV